MGVLAYSPRGQIFRWNLKNVHPLPHPFTKFQLPWMIRSKYGTFWAGPVSFCPTQFSFGHSSISQLYPPMFNFLSFSHHSYTTFDNPWFHQLMVNFELGVWDSFSWSVATYLMFVWTPSTCKFEHMWLIRSSDPKLMPSRPDRIFSVRSDVSLNEDSFH